VSVAGALAGLQAAYQGLVQHPAIRATLTVQPYGAAELRGLVTPVIFLVGPPEGELRARWTDRAAALSGLPRRVRRRTVLVEDAQQAASLVDRGWHVLASTEDDVRMAAIAIEERISVVPVGVRGTVAAIEPGRIRPVPGRPRVAVRYGQPVRPATGESAAALAGRVAGAIRELVAEDVGTWWQVRRHGTTALPPLPGGWRRVWAQTEPPLLGGRQPPPKIWPG